MNLSRWSPLACASSGLRALSTVSALAWAVAGYFAPASQAEACGGTFCDTVTGMSVDQTGENILFVLDGNRTEAHIQIQYDPESGAEKFAWVVPVMSVPDFAVGSEQLFSNILAGTVPFYGMQQFSVCDDSDGDSGGDSGDGGNSGGEEEGSDSDTGGDEDPKVVKEESVGAYEIAVLQGGTVDSVMAWLDENGFTQDEMARPILEAYLAENFLFVAMKLGNQAGVDEIQPIVLSFEDQDPCVPLRLTKIAAVEDMHVRTFFLGDGRVIPENYRHVEVNPLKIDWLSFAENYPEVVALAVDVEHAEGNAFVTEYAGSSDQVSQDGLFDFGWHPQAIADLQDNPSAVVDELTRQKLIFCTNEDWNEEYSGEEWECEYYHSLLRPLLRRYLPAPEGVEEAEFYGCLSCFVDQIDLEQWDAEAFAVAMQERIVDPGSAAVRLLERHAYMTRMYTRISPDEMNVDPIFVPSPTLPEVPNRRVATRRIECNGDSVVELPDGRLVHIPAGEGWPSFSPEMPDEETVHRSQDAQLELLVSRTALIDRLLAEWNDGDDTGTETGSGSSSSETGPGTDGQTTSTQTTGGGNTSGTTDAESSDDSTGGHDHTGEGEGTAADDETGASVLDAGTGCACRASRSENPSGSLAWMALAAVLGLGWRRRGQL